MAVVACALSVTVIYGMFSNQIDYYNLTFEMKIKVVNEKNRTLLLINCRCVDEFFQNLATGQNAK